MKHLFSDAQIIEASQKAGTVAGLQYATLSIDYLHAFADALPDPATDEWQDVTDIRQIRRGDMLKNETENAVIRYKYAAKRVDLSNGIIHLDNDEVIFWHDNHTYYRIPAPVVHPNPAEHPVILIPRYNGVDKEPHWTPAAWDGQYYKTINAPEYFSSNEITNWKPGKVVEDDR